MDKLRANVASLESDKKGLLEKVETQANSIQQYKRLIENLKHNIQENSGIRSSQESRSAIEKG